MALPSATQELTPAQDIAVNAVIHSAQDALLASSGISAAVAGKHITNVRKYDFIPFMAVWADTAGLKALANSPMVAGLEEDTLHFPTLLQSVPQQGQTRTSRWDGRGKIVVIEDTGVDKNHPMLRRICPGRNICSRAVQALLHNQALSE